MKKQDEKDFMRAEYVNKLTRILVIASKRLGVPVEDLSTEVLNYAKFKTRKKK